MKTQFWRLTDYAAYERRSDAVVKSKKHISWQCINYVYLSITLHAKQKRNEYWGVIFNTHAYWESWIIVILSSVPGAYDATYSEVFFRNYPHIGEHNLPEPLFSAATNFRICCWWLSLSQTIWTYTYKHPVPFYILASLFTLFSAVIRHKCSTLKSKVHTKLSQFNNGWFVQLQ